MIVFFALAQIVAIDALSFSPYSTTQYKVSSILREILKAYVGFSVPSSVLEGAVVSSSSATAAFASSSSKQFPKPFYSQISTGRWGCGAFNGDFALKAVIQWIAATR